jgi:hypothetical protein
LIYANLIYLANNEAIFSLIEKSSKKIEAKTNTGKNLRLNENTESNDKF